MMGGFVVCEFDNSVPRSRCRALIRLLIERQHPTARRAVLRVSSLC